MDMIVGQGSKIKLCPFCKAVPHVSIRMGDAYIRAEHKHLSCPYYGLDTYSKCDLPIEEQIEVWNQMISEKKDSFSPDMKIEDLYSPSIFWGFGNRAYTCLKQRGDIQTLGDIIALSREELYATHGIGEYIGDEIVSLIHKLGYKFKDEEEEEEMGSDEVDHLECEEERVSSRFYDQDEINPVLWALLDTRRQFVYDQEHGNNTGLQTPLDMFVKDLPSGISTRVYNALVRANVWTVRDIIELGPEKIRHLSHIGEKAYRETVELLVRDYGESRDIWYPTQRKKRKEKK